ncbi:MAG: heme ABC exporter ATP-binding protein CcmA [Candidatus Zixiibacteriota bacterium]
MISLEARDLGKWFGQRKVFDGVSFLMEEGESLVITGKNGSGKTTLLKILCGLTRPTEGEVILSSDGETIPQAKSRSAFGVVMPDLELYGELTARENLKYLSRIRGLFLREDELREKIARMGLAGRDNDLVSSFSSGMRQRLKYAFALLHQPQILLLDEPSANLDQEGTALVDEIVQEHKERGIVVLATNEKADFKYGDQIVQLGT